MLPPFGLERHTLAVLFEPDTGAFDYRSDPVVVQVETGGGKKQFVVLTIMQRVLQ